MMFRSSVAALLLGFGGLLSAAPAEVRQPIYVVLYSRFYDHGRQHFTNERLQRLLPLLERSKAKSPGSGISALIQVSGTVSELLAEENRNTHLVDRLKLLSNQGLVEFGYTGEDEPSYLYRPKPNLLTAVTPEERWAAKGEAARRFLTDYKNPITGLPIEGLTGGLKRTQEVFGDVAFISGISVPLGGDSAVVHEAIKLSPGAMLTGIPAADPKRGVEGFGFSAGGFSKSISPEPTLSPEVFWQDNVLRLSDASLADNKPHSSDEGVEELKKWLGTIDRSKVRVVRLEIAGYRRYLAKRADGSLVSDPMEWMYYHPDEPALPQTLKSLTTQTESEAGLKKDEAVMKWLLEEFFPANTGSRFLSIRELNKLPGPISEVSSDQLKSLAVNFGEHFAKLPMEPPDFGRAGDAYFTLAESFDLFARALSELNKTGSLPKSLKVQPIYGPLGLPLDMGSTTGTLSVSQLMQIAAQLTPKLGNSAWKPVPDNAVPAIVKAGTLRLNAAQLLRLMAQAYLDPKPDRMLGVNAITLTTKASFLFPKNTPMTDQSSAWTIKPATLKTVSAHTVVAAR